MKKPPRREYTLVVANSLNEIPSRIVYGTDKNMAMKAVEWAVEDSLYVWLEVTHHGWRIESVRIK